MQKPLTNAMLATNSVEAEQWKALKITVEQQRDLFETKKPLLSELECLEEERKLCQMESLLDDLKVTWLKKQLNQLINDPSIDEQLAKKDVVEDFLAWDKQEAIEALNFLLTEFFTHSYPKNNWNNTFITNMVFQHSRIVNLITGLKNVKDQ